MIDCKASILTLHDEAAFGSGTAAIEPTPKMVYFLTMSDKSLNIHEAKTHLSEHLAALGAGDRIILCRRNRPIAEIRPLPSPRSVPRPVGLGKGLATLPEGFLRRCRTRCSICSMAAPGRVTSDAPPAGHLHVPVVGR